MSNPSFDLSSNPVVFGVGGEAAPTDLNLRYREIRSLAQAETEAGHWLDAFLLVAAMGQVLEDEFHRSRGAFDRLAEVVANRWLGRMAKVAAAGIRILHRARAHRLGTRRNEMIALSVDLAAAYLQGDVPPPMAQMLRRRVRDAAGLVPGAPALDERVMRPPSCFRSFDQHPQDVVALVAEFGRTADPVLPVLVIGVRTSGSYLGALAVGALRNAGFTQVDFITVRPGEHLDRSQRRAVAAVGRGGSVLVLDDPPVSGDAIARVASEARRACRDGVDVILLLASDRPDGRLPIPLDPYRRHVVRQHEWELRRRLAGSSVRAQLHQLLGDGESLVDVVDVPSETASNSARDHASRRFRATLRSAPADDVPVVVIAQCVGLGFFGRHAVETARVLGGRVPRILGFVDGVLYQIVQTPAFAQPNRSPGRAEEIGEYSAARQLALPATDDRSRAIKGHQAVWEVAAELVGRACGRLDVALRLPVINRVVRSILEIPTASVIDGRMTGDVWFDTPDGLCKADFSEGACSNRDLACYDAAFDVASSFGPAPDRDELAVARRTFERLVGLDVAASRWLLLRLVHAWDQRRSGILDEMAWEADVSSALADFVGEVLIDVPRASPTGPWVGIDLDGVLETGLLGGSAPGMAGAIALRSLTAHGYRAVPVTGRGATEVANRIAAWGLVGGVVEYGAGLVLPGESELVDLRDRDGREAMDDVRGWLAGRDDVRVAPSHRFGVRASHVTPSGRSLGRLPRDVEAAAVAAGGGASRVEAVRGDDQTDFVPVGVDKGRGVRALLAQLDPHAEGTTTLALAVGDGPADRSLLALADLAVVPSHSRRLAADTGATVTRHAYQAGLADAVGMLIGHRPGGCPECAVDMAPHDDLLLRLLSLREAGPWGVGPRTVQAVVAALRSSALRSAKRN